MFETSSYEGRETDTEFIEIKFVVLNFVLLLHDAKREFFMGSKVLRLEHRLNRVSKRLRASSNVESWGRLVSSPLQLRRVFLFLYGYVRKCEALEAK